MKFDDAFTLVAKEEGNDRVSDDPKDPGGLTKWGISLRSHPELGREGILSLTRDAAKKIYKREYWDQIQTGKFPLRMRLFILDMAVNHGVGGASRIIQKTANEKGSRLAVDGVVGLRTLAAVKSIDPLEFLTELAWQRIAFDRNLPTYGRFGEGWEKRVLRIAFQTKGSLG